MCRRPLSLGHNPLYEVVADGVPKIQDPRREAQALCGPDYKTQWQEVYSEVAIPDIVDGFLDLTEVPLPLLTDLAARGINVSSGDDLALWDRAIEAARASGGAESVAHAYRRLSNQVVPDVEISGPVYSLEDQAAALEHEFQVEQTADSTAGLIAHRINTDAVDREEGQIQGMAQALRLCRACLDDLRGTENFPDELKHAYERGLDASCGHLEGES
jgi:hypothetical protein